MDHGFVVALAASAVSVGALHSLAPDHWAPLAAVARVQGWSRGRTARVTLLCGFGHVSVSVLLAVLALASGSALFEAFGRRLEPAAALLLAAFGFVYGAWGLRQAAGRRFHGHVHASYDHVHDAERATSAASSCSSPTPVAAGCACRGSTCTATRWSAPSWLRSASPWPAWDGRVRRAWIV
jgi:ABC-type nickel/cobalt efflux system permease component RcnA